MAFPLFLLHSSCTVHSGWVRMMWEFQNNPPGGHNTIHRMRCRVWPAPDLNSEERPWYLVGFIVCCIKLTLCTTFRVVWYVEFQHTTQDKLSATRWQHHNCHMTSNQCHSVAAPHLSHDLKSAFSDWVSELLLLTPDQISLSEILCIRQKYQNYNFLNRKQNIPEVKSLYYMMEECHISFMMKSTLETP